MMIPLTAAIMHGEDVSVTLRSCDFSCKLSEHLKNQQKAAVVQILKGQQREGFLSPQDVAEMLILIK